jgi:hypothetical protein
MPKHRILVGACGEKWIQVAALGSWWEKKQISAVTVVLLLGEKTIISCYCGSTAGNRQKNRILVGACGEKLYSSCSIR